METETSLMPGANAGHTLNIQPVHALVQHCCLHSPRSLHESACECVYVTRTSTQLLPPPLTESSAADGESLGSRDQELIYKR